MGHNLPAPLIEHIDASSETNSARREGYMTESVVRFREVGVSENIQNVRKYLLKRERWRPGFPGEVLR
jgi:hypothetical protein